MKTQLKNVSNKFFAVIALAIILTGAAFAQKTDGSDNIRKLIAENAQRDLKIQNKTSAANKTVLSAANSLNFVIGKDFALAVYDANDMDLSDESLNYTIVDLVYLIDELEGQTEAAQLQKILKSVVRRTLTGEEISKEIENVSKSYLARQKVEQQWFYNSGFSSMNLLIAAYSNDVQKTKNGLSELQNLIKLAPTGTPKEIIEPINALAKFAAKTTFTGEDYAAIHDQIENVFNVFYA